jgi:hypothetical protein
MNPFDLPVEQPFNLIINIRAARTLLLAIPSPFIRAEEVIE